jgi:hypothetical protein
MRDHRAAIPVAQVLVAHPVVLLQVAAPHLRNHLVQIVNVAVKIYRRAEVHPIVAVQRVKFRKGVKPVIHAGFVPSR